MPQRVVFFRILVGLLFVVILIALVRPMVWLAVFPLAFLVAAMLDDSIR